MNKYIKGTLTIEAGIVITAIILALSLLIYISLLFYENSIISNIVDSVTLKASYNWDFQDYDEQKKKDPLYPVYFVLNIKEKELKIKKDIEAQIMKKSILENSTINIKAVRKPNIIYNSLEIQVTINYDLPEIFEAIYKNDNKISVVKKRAILINDNASLINNVDLTLDLNKIYGITDLLTEKIKKIEKIISTIKNTYKN